MTLILAGRAYVVTRDNFGPRIPLPKRGTNAVRQVASGPMVSGPPARPAARPPLQG
jgi:hypothetical protein